jgi:5'-methylthioinosine phosphorylase
MRRLGLIGGSGLDQWGTAGTSLALTSPFGEPSAPPQEIDLGNLRLFFIPRHGARHQLPPHAVNYRANIDVLKQLRVEGIIAINAVGAITAQNSPGSLAVPDQLIDYTWGRQHSFSMGADDELRHVEFSSPFDGYLRTILLNAADAAGLEVTDGGCVGVSQGPRLETAAEIRRMARDGCDMVGMTSMPEAALARERGLAYASLCVNANWAAGLSAEPVSMAAIEATLADAMSGVRSLLRELFKEYSNVGS